MGTYVVERRVLVHAPAERVHERVADFRQWVSWSPWEGLDPALDRVYSGPDAGVGSRYAWSGNRKAGRGSMQVTGASPDRIDVQLEFLKPFRSTAAVVFELAPTDAGTEVTWRMEGEQTGLMGVVGRVVPMDRLIGKDLERGLARLKAVSEETA
ncbi:transcriptional regulator [Marmoricola sp. Leaf446]|uniref:SRPBCC family protein n=1 Tax=Marmoricola sp. Leaf446 TaxID=1736379 RepID=UPI0006F36734|nr:SRPBCC family protein [Marmoricola sp. Leaf446]KQT93663.1 transcriptional regulator [Marmoricola sp. Leaf446]